LTPNGKLDRASLPLPSTENRSAAPPESFDETETRLAALWRTVLRCSEVTRSANFFELCGHSLLAAQLLVRIEAEFGRRLTLAATFKSPTIAEQAKLLRRKDDRDFDFRQVVKLQPNGSRPPIISIHNTGIFFGLCKHLGPDQPFTSLQLFDPSLRESSVPETIEDIAAGYLQLIKRIQPTGPYIFAGWCIAGTVTFEVARQLQASTGESATLLVMDTWAPGYLRRLPWLRSRLADYSYRLQLIAIDWRKVLSGKQTFADFLMSRATVKKLRRLLGLAKTDSAASASVDFNVSDETYDRRLLEHLERAARSYEPQGAQLRVGLFRSSQEPRGLFLDYDMGWSTLAQLGVEVTLIDGDHTTMFQSPGVQRMAGEITSRIDAICARTK
jgi:thioesterase domain-containing protein